MKKIILLTTCILIFNCFASNAQQVIHFNEDFNTGFGGTNFFSTTIFGTPPWKIGRPAINDFSGSGIAHYNDDSAGVQSFGPNISSLLSPTFDNSFALKTYVEFDYNFYSKITNDSFYVEVGSQMGAFGNIAFFTSTSACGVWNSPSCLNNYPHAKIDISNVKRTNNYIKLTYSWGNGNGGYLAIDNLMVYSDTTYVSSNFSNPLDSTFTTTIISGNANWKIGNPIRNNLNNQPLAYFDDDSLGASNTNNTVHLTSKVFDNTLTPNSYLEFDYNFYEIPNVSDSFYVEVYDGTNWNKVFIRTTNDCGVWNSPNCLNNYPRASVDISAFANANCQVRFVYHDGNDWAGYLAIDNIMISPNSITSVKKMIVTSNFSIYPNPNHGTFQIELSEDLIGEEYYIYNLSGQSIRSGNFKNRNEPLDISNEKAGIYFLQVPNKGINKKVVVY